MLRDRLRRRLQRDPQPSAGSRDSQSVKTTAVGGIRGSAGGKKLVGRKRHILVDTEGLGHAVNVHPASIMDRDGLKLVRTGAIRARLTRRQLRWLDAGYHGRGKGKDGVEQVTGGRVETGKAIQRFKRSWGPTSSRPSRLLGRSRGRKQVATSLRAGGSLKERSLGFCSSDDCAGTTSGPGSPARPGCTSPGSASWYAASLASEGVIKRSLTTRPLRS